MKKIKLIHDEIVVVYLDKHPVPSKEVLPIKDNSNNSNYVVYSDLTPEQVRIVKKRIEEVNYNFSDSILIKVNDKYIGTYGKCGAWRFVFNYLGIQSNVLTHDWSGCNEVVKINSLWGMWN